MNPRSWLRSSAARLTLTYGVVVLLLVVALQGTVWLLTRDALEREVRRVMTTELDKLLEVYNAQGMGELSWVLRTRADSTTPSTRQTGWSPASWSAAGTRHCRLSQSLKERSPP